MAVYNGFTRSSLTSSTQHSSRFTVMRLVALATVTGIMNPGKLMDAAR